MSCLQLKFNITQKNVNTVFRYATSGVIVCLRVGLCLIGGSARTENGPVGISERAADSFSLAGLYGSYPLEMLLS